MLPRGIPTLGRILGPGPKLTSRFLKDNHDLYHIRDIESCRGLGTQTCLGGGGASEMAANVSVGVEPGPMGVGPAAGSWSYVQGTSKQSENAQGPSGKSINAKKLTGAAPMEMSHRMHASYGLENYPNYLLKWPRPKVASHIESLKRELAVAENAAAALAARDAYVATYEPLHAYLRRPTAERVLCASAQASVDGVWDVRDEFRGEIFSVQLLSDACCRDLSEEFQNYLAFRKAYVERTGEDPPGTLRERLTLAEVGLLDLEAFLLDALRDLVSRLFPGDVG